MEAITVRELLEAVNGTLLGSYADLDRTVDRVDTDSRSVHEGALFIPLVGERFDGHAYINSALEAGAAGCLTARERTSYQEGKFYIKVGNTQRALRDLAAWYKNRFQIPFVGGTGSVGKTTAKDMIAAVLRAFIPIQRNELQVFLQRTVRVIDRVAFNIGDQFLQVFQTFIFLVGFQHGTITAVGQDHFQQPADRC